MLAIIVFSTQNKTLPKFTKNQFGLQHLIDESRTKIVFFSIIKRHGHLQWFDRSTNIIHKNSKQKEIQEKRKSRVDLNNDKQNNDKTVGKSPL